MSGKTGVKVFAPAAIANFSVGLGVLSVAVNQPGDEIVAKLKPGNNGISIKSIQGYKKGLSLDPANNSASLAGQLLLDHIKEDIGIELEIFKNIPLNSGFSSNASSAVAGVFAVNELLDKPLKRSDLLDFALQAESKFSFLPNYSQVCSILFGGIILYRNTDNEKFQKLYTPHGLSLTLIMPEISIKEKTKLDLLSNQVDINTYISHSSNLAAFVSSLYTSNFNLFSDSLQHDTIYTELRSIVPCFENIKSIVTQEGGYGCGLAGLGPGIFIVSPNTLIADEIAIKVECLYKKDRLSYKLFQTEINLNGVYQY